MGLLSTHILKPWDTYIMRGSRNFHHGEGGGGGSDVFFFFFFFFKFLFFHSSTSVICRRGSMGYFKENYQLPIFFQDSREVQHFPRRVQYFPGVGVGGGPNAYSYYRNLI